MSTYYEKMKFEMELRCYSQQTQKHYLNHVRLLERHFGKPVNQITPDDIRQYLHHRIKTGISYSNINISCNAFKLMFNSVLNRNFSDDTIVRPKKLKKLPYVLSNDEVLSILNIPTQKCTLPGRFDHSIRSTSARYSDRVQFIG